MSWLCQNKGKVWITVGGAGTHVDVGFAPVHSLGS